MTPMIALLFCVILPIILTVALIVLVFVFDHLKDKKAEAYCTAHGLTYYGRNVPDAHKMIQGTSLDQGHSHLVKFGIGQKLEGREVITFQWQYTVGSGKYQSTAYYRVAMTEVDLRSGGWLIMRREGLLDKAASMLGHNDLDFENKEFSNRYYVQAGPESFAYQVFHPRMIELFLKYRDYEMVVRRGKVMIYQEGTMGGPFTALELMLGKNPFAVWMSNANNMLSQILERIPKFIRKKRGLEKLTEDDQVEIVDPEALDSDEEGAQRIECPSCSHKFSISKGQKAVVCPKCGTEGEV